MLKVVVFDSGFGGELLADYLEEELPLVEVIRVIDWRNASTILTSPKQARKAAETALRPYVDHVDLIIFANYLISITSLKYFRQKYKSQKFAGFRLKNEQIIYNKPTVIFTTKAVSRTINFFKFAHSIKAKIITLDDWPNLIDDGELTIDKIKSDLKDILAYPKNSLQIILACGQFVDIKSDLKTLLGHNTKFIDPFDDTLRQTCLTLKIRGSLKKKK